MFERLEPISDARESLGMKQTLFHVLLLSALGFAGASTAQETIPLRGPDYFRDAGELAQTLGYAHAIRVRCNGREDQYWRRYMVDMLNYEAPERGALRSRLVDRFNDAYSAASRLYQVCDGRTSDAEARYASQGKILAERLATHYFPQDGRR